ncbi:MAG: hypothetical protein KDE31_32335, partial [Caldilineaceae bacterium]|nr:hypothetical protein [Caldilineaceae bacterium]
MLLVKPLLRLVASIAVWILFSTVVLAQEIPVTTFPEDQSSSPFADITAPIEWYRYQGAPKDSNCPGGNADCGPTAVAMAIQYAQIRWVPIAEIRQYMGGQCGDSTSLAQLEKALNNWEVSYTEVGDMDAVRSAVNENGKIVI